MSNKDFELMNTHVFQFDSGVVVVAAAGTTAVYTLVLNGVPFSCTAEIINADDADAFDAFTIEAQVHPDGAWSTYITGAELTAGTALPGRLNRVVGNPPALVAAAVASVQFEGVGLHAVRFSGSGAAASAAQVRGNMVHLM